MSNKTENYLWKVHLSHPKDGRRIIEEWYGNGYIRGFYIGDSIDGVDELTPDCIYLYMVRPKGMESYKQKLEQLAMLEKFYSVEENTCMVVLRIPERHKKAYKHFMRSEYSRMFDREFLEQLKKEDGHYPPSYHVLAKTEIGRQALIKEYNLSQDFQANEYDGLWSPEQELFHYKPVPVLR